ncbi:hypothetical protein CSV79_08695 [Sporosarcina sp. P13]|nr:hypothetical protein CSV79_08695 [Sporosarcina sp. P13]
MLVCFLIMQHIHFFELKTFLKVITFISLIISAFLFYQLSIVAVGGIPHNGVLFKSLIEENSWSKSYMRPNSFFSEPSYLAIYLLPVIGLLLNYQKYLLVLFFYSVLILSTSTLGIVGGGIILILYTVLNRKVKLLILTIIILFLFYVIAIKYFDLEWLMQFNIDKTVNIQDRSQIRVAGYLEYFELIPTFNQIIGVGFGQLSNYFKAYNLANYSNAFVLMLINFGIIGFLTYVLFIMWSFLKSKKEGFFLY